jgi:SAM-dependent methyltransferase
MSATDPQAYIFGDTHVEQQRLVVQAESYERPARWLLDQVGIQLGWQAIDIGCGPLGILNLLSERVGSGGAVVGLEKEQRFAQMAQNEVVQRSLNNVTVLQADALADGLQKRSFDFAHERLVMVNISAPDTFLSRMIELVRPGGIVAVEEVDNASWLCHPPHPSWDKLLLTFHAAFRACGGDVFIGRRLPELLRTAGLENVQYKVHVDVAALGGYRRKHLLALLDSLSDKVMTLGLLTDDEFTRHKELLTLHLDCPNTIVIDKLLVQAWGRKPT